MRWIVATTSMRSARGSSSCDAFILPTWTEVFLRTQTSCSPTVFAQTQVHNTEHRAFFVPNVLPTNSSKHTLTTKKRKYKNNKTTQIEQSMGEGLRSCQKHEIISKNKPWNCTTHKRTETCSISLQRLFPFPNPQHCVRTLTFTKSVQDECVDARRDVMETVWVSVVI